MKALPIRITVNGEAFEASPPPLLRLSELLRRGLGLTGAHVGCNEGVCGACTVLIDDKAVCSCLVLAAQCDGARIETVESLADAGRLSALQHALMHRNALQCGFCTPGILMLAEQARRAGAGEADGLLNAFLCRCTGYRPIALALADVLTDVPE